MVDKESFFWLQIEGEEKLATENLIPGNQVYNEKLVQLNAVEYRIWNPFRSKLAAAIMNGLDDFPFKQKSDVLEKIGKSQKILGFSTNSQCGFLVF